MESGINVTFRIPVWLDKICAWPVMVYRKHKYGEAFRRINLGEGEFTIVDPDVYYRLGRYNWGAAGEDGGKTYAARILRKTEYGRIQTIYMHREIMQPPIHIQVDHKNLNPLDNRRSNLRLATSTQNEYNKGKRRTKTSSRFIGVCFDKQRNNWLAYINYERKRIWLGRFDNEIDAARAYDRAAIKYHGEFARLNFPEEAHVS